MNDAKVGAIEITGRDCVFSVEGALLFKMTRIDGGKKA